MKKHWLSLFLVLLLIVLPIDTALAQVDTPKEEVIYGVLNNDGTNSQIYVVNSFDLADAGEVTDYGTYTNVTNLTTTDPISYEQGKVRFHAPKGRFYYQGDLMSNDLPWLFTITYQLDGQSISAEDLAGKTGQLDIHVSIQKNPLVNPLFYDHYTIQATVTLDAIKCSNIQAEGATIANAGSNKLLTYAVLPGNDKDFLITSYVTDFTMSGIQFTGVPLSMDLEEVDLSEFMDQVSQLQDGISQLNEGADDLSDGIAATRDGAQSLTGGISQFQNGLNDFHSGLTTFSRGIAALRQGASDLSDGLSALKSQSASMVQGSSDIKQGLDGILDAFKQYARQMNDAFTSAEQLLTGCTEFQNGLDSLSDSAPSLSESVNDIADGVSSNADQLDQIASGKIEDLALDDPDNADVQKVIHYYNSQMTQVETVSQSLHTLEGLCTAFDAAYNHVSETLAALCLQFHSIHDSITSILQLVNPATAMNQLVSSLEMITSNYQSFDSGINQYTQSVDAIQAGYESVYEGIGNLAENSEGLSNGFSQLASGIGQLYDGSYQLVSGINQLLNGSGQLADGTGELKDNTADMDVQIQDEINDITGQYDNSDLQIESFVSDQNGHVNVVQFVIKTPGISKQLTDPVIDAAPSQLSLWQKILRLFR